MNSFISIYKYLYIAAGGRQGGMADIITTYAP